MCEIARKRCVSLNCASRTVQENFWDWEKFWGGTRRKWAKEKPEKTRRDLRLLLKPPAFNPGRNMLRHAPRLQMTVCFAMKIRNSSQGRTRSSARKHTNLFKSRRYPTRRQYTSWNKRTDERSTLKSFKQFHGFQTLFRKHRAQTILKIVSRMARRRSKTQQ